MSRHPQNENQQFFGNLLLEARARTHRDPKHNTQDASIQGQQTRTQFRGKDLYANSSPLLRPLLVPHTLAAVRLGADWNVNEMTRELFNESEQFGATHFVEASRAMGKG
jgi:hypothetical protein